MHCLKKVLLKKNGPVRTKIANKPTEPKLFRVFGGDEGESNPLSKRAAIRISYKLSQSLFSPCLPHPAELRQGQPRYLSHPLAAWEVKHFDLLRPLRSFEERGG